MKISSADRNLSENNNKVGSPLIPLVIIIGPTAAGKSEIAILLAEKFNGEIVSADSRLFYRGMDIGTAKPTMQDRLRVPHHLIDVADPDEVWSLALFQKEAGKIISDISHRHTLPFLVGGTGQFIRSMVEGWSIPSVKPNPRLRQILTEWSKTVGSQEIHKKLAILDQNAANAIGHTNVRRTIRALEVILTTGKRFSDLRTSGKVLYNPLLLGLTSSRAELYQRIDERITRMISSGLIDEVQRLLEHGYSPELPTMSAIGYREIIAYIQGEITLDEAIRLMKRRTRIYVRRQANWFKIDDPDIHWFQANRLSITEMEDTINTWLKKIGW